MAQPVLKNANLDALISNENFAAESVRLKTAATNKSVKEKADFITFTEKNVLLKRKKIKTPAPDAVSLDDAATGSFGNQSLELIIGNDDRQKVSDVFDSPWKKIAALVITSQSGTQYAGTGWFISPRVLVTAGHCVFLHDVGGFAKQIEVIPAMCGKEERFGRHVSTKFMSSNGWVNDRNSDYDYGIIILDKPVSEDIGWFAFAAATDENLNGQIVNISGYPRDEDKYTFQYFHAKEVDRCSRHKVYYSVDTTGGDSGACIWLTMGENERVVVGLHTTGSSITNYGTRITEAMFNNFKKIKNEYK